MAKQTGAIEALRLTFPDTYGLPGAKRRQQAVSHQERLTTMTTHTIGNRSA